MHRGAPFWRHREALVEEGKFAVGSRLQHAVVVTAKLAKATVPQIAQYGTARHHGYPRWQNGSPAAPSTQGKRRTRARHASRAIQTANAALIATARVHTVATERAARNPLPSSFCSSAGYVPTPPQRTHVSVGPCVGRSAGNSQISQDRALPRVSRWHIW